MGGGRKGGENGGRGRKGGSGGRDIAPLSLGHGSLTLHSLILRPTLRKSAVVIFRLFPIILLGLHCSLSKKQGP